MTKTVEYRVRPMTRYHVTRYEEQEHEDGCNSGGVESLGTFDNLEAANRVCVQLAASEPNATANPLVFGASGSSGPKI